MHEPLSVEELPKNVKQMRDYRAKVAKEREDGRRALKVLQALHTGIKESTGTTRAIPGLFVSDDVFADCERLAGYLSGQLTLELEPEQKKTAPRNRKRKTSAS